MLSTRTWQITEVPYYWKLWGLLQHAVITTVYLSVQYALVNYCSTLVLIHVLFIMCPFWQLVPYSGYKWLYAVCLGLFLRTIFLEWHTFSLRYTLVRMQDHYSILNVLDYRFQQILSPDCQRWLHCTGVTVLHILIFQWFSSSATAT